VLLRKQPTVSLETSPKVNKQKASSRITRASLVVKDDHRKDISKKQQRAHDGSRMIRQSDDWFWQSDDPAITPGMTVCPRDEVEGNKLLTQSERDKVDRMVKMTNLQKLGSNLKIGCAFKMTRNYRQRALDAIQSWGRKCDKIYAFSDEEWTMPGGMGVTTIPLKQDGSDDYEHLWHKTRLIFQSLVDFWDKDGLDFVAMADDDAFYVMENLRGLLASGNIQKNHAAGKPVLLGDVWEDRSGNTAPGMNVWVNGGGYVLNRVAAKEVHDCTKRLSDKNEIPEDIMVCSCMKHSKWNFDLHQESNACDDSGKKLFSQESLLTTYGDHVDKMSSTIVEFHHATGEQRHRFFQSLYNDQSKRLCAEVDPDTLVTINATLQMNKKQKDKVLGKFFETMKRGQLYYSSQSMLEKDRCPSCPAPCPMKMGISPTGMVQR